jgi:tetratricopeptide (TPR) repeat protein
MSEPPANRKKTFFDGFPARLRPVLPGAAIILAVFLVYLPALSAGFIWDDAQYVTQNLTLRSVEGLRRIWLEIGAVPQYYPLVHSTYWVEYHLWGLNPLGYHIVNVLLHGLGAVLLWRVLVKLQVPGAGLAAGLFAVHPVCVESVAWVTERKNVLCGVFYFAAALAYLRFSGKSEAPEPAAQTRPSPFAFPASDWYRLSLFLFACALLSKTVACSLPAALLLVAWWKRGRITCRDAWPVLPFFVIGAGLGLLTAHIEKAHVGAQGAEWNLSIIQRCLIAGRALWFYAGKLVWPANLTFIYPRWEVSAGVWWQWLFPVAALGMVMALWLLRKRMGRGPLAAVLFFAGTLFPALGFINVYPMRYSFVADHFQYLAQAGLLALVASLIYRLPGLFRRCCAGGLLAVLCGLTWLQAHTYRDLETLWRTTITRNPACWMAYNNLGVAYENNGQYPEAVDCFQNTIRIKPDYVEALCNLGDIAFVQGRSGEAIDYYRRALQYHPGSFIPLRELGITQATTGHIGEAVGDYYRAIQAFPYDPAVFNNLAWILATCPDGHYRDGAEAVRLAERACDLDQRKTPLYVGTLAAAYAEAGRFPEAVATAETAEQLASQAGLTAVADKNSQLLELYQAGKPYRDPDPARSDRTSPQ